MNSHQRRKARRRHQRKYPWAFTPYQVDAIKKLRGFAKSGKTVVIERSLMAGMSTMLLHFQRIGRVLRAAPKPNLIIIDEAHLMMPTGPTIAELQRDGHLPTTNQERT